MDPITAEEQASVTPTEENLGGKETVTSTENDGKNNTENVAFRTFKTQEDFDKHSAGIKRSAEKEAEKKIMAMLGLNPDQKDKLAEYKKTYEASLTDAEKQTKEIETLNSEVSSLKEAVEEKNAIIATLSKITGKSSDDVSKITKMARGLVSETVSMDEALEEVFALMKIDGGVPKGTPPVQTETQPIVNEVNPFAKETFNMTEQGRLLNTDPEKARRLYALANNGKLPNW